MASDKLPFEAYRGEDGYIFASYAHADSSTVYEELARLNSEGFNLWFDEGITPSSRWSDELAGAIDRSSVFLAFITPRFVASRNCINEIEFALSRGIPIVAVHLEETELPPGLQLNLGSRQAIVREKYRTEAYRRKLRNHLSQVLGGQDPEDLARGQQPHGGRSVWHGIAEMRRRNVFKVGAAYAVVNWLLIQVGDVVLSTFEAPPWMMQGLISVAILGFPVALVLAWVYELTPVGVKRSDDVLRQASVRWLTARRLNAAIVVLLVLAVVVLVFDNYVSPRLTSSGEPEIESLAVLAFEDHSTDKDGEYFADGLADELLSILGRVKELKVASRTASFYYKGKDVDIGTIGERLNVGDVLSGSVRREGERIRVTAVLDNIESGSVSWTETYDRRLEGILDIQSDIAQSVAASILPIMSPESRARITARPTEDAEAFDYYLRGRAYLRRPAEESTLASALKLFGKAIELDPEFAQAHAGLCETHLADFEFSAKPVSFQKAEIACRKALSLDSGLWEVHVALGDLYRVNGQYDDAIVNLKAAIELQPNAVNAYLALAQTYAAQDNLALAEETFKKAEKVESGYWGVHRAFGNFLYEQSRLDEAIERHLKVTELAPDSGIGHDNLGNIYLALGDLERAEAIFDASPLPSRWTYTNRGLVHYFRHDFIAAIADHERAIALAPDDHTAWGLLADAYRFVADGKDHARGAYEKAIELAQRQLNVNPADPDILARLGMYYAYMGQDERARTQIERLLELTPDVSTYQYYVMRVRLQLGDARGAIESLQRAVQSGWSRDLLSRDPDLEALHNEDGYRAVMSEPGA
jgi:TolB-like protein/Flp pilus assembly protein TadD